jgi:RNA polymerase sigma factor (sigma-70 family)
VETSVPFFRTKIFGLPIRLKEWMKGAMSTGVASTNDDSRILEWINHGQSRLRNFIRRRVADAADAEDIFQDSLYELVEALRLVRPVEHIGPWLFRVARNRITDLYRKTGREASTDDLIRADEDGGLLEFGDFLPSPEAGPEAAYARGVLLDEIAAALDELPDEQRLVFIAHEIEGRTFKELSAETGVCVNTLLSRKHQAVLKLRRRLQTIYREFAKG